MNVRLGRGPMGALLLIAPLALVGCRSRMLPVEAKGRVVTESGHEEVIIDVVTQPGAVVSTYSLGSARATADATGKATLKLKGWSGNAARQTFYVSAERSEKRILGRPRFLYGSTQVSLERPPGVRLVPAAALAGAYAPRASVSCIGDKACAGLVQSNFTLRFTDIESDAIVDFGGSKVRVPSTGRTVVAVPDVAKLLGAVSLSDVFKDYPLSNFDVPLEIAFADGTTVQTKANFPANALRPALGTAFDKLAVGPVRFDGDGDGPSLDRSLLLVPKGRIFGDAPKVTDLDLVAVSQDKSRFLSCGSYKGETSGRLTTVSRSLTDAHVTLYERRTGKIRAKQVFLAEPPPCPTTTYGSTTTRATYEEAAVDAWLRGFVKSP